MEDIATNTASCSRRIHVKFETKNAESRLRGYWKSRNMTWMRAEDDQKTHVISPDVLGAKADKIDEPQPDIAIAC
jgi:hypothetical protein